MGYSAFCDSISSPSLKAVANHWYQARGACRMPRWADIQPRAIAAQLPIIWSYKYDHATGIFTGRLAGDRIARLFKKDFRGLPLVEAQAPEAFAWAHKLYSRVVLEPAIYRGAGRVLKQLQQYGGGERLMLPLSSDDVIGDGILGITEFHYPDLVPNIPVAAIGEMEEWFTLADVKPDF
jgi:hypothetical protein